MTSPAPSRAVYLHGAVTLWLLMSVALVLVLSVASALGFNCPAQWSVTALVVMAAVIAREARRAIRESERGDR